MTPNRLRTALARLGLSQRAAARRLGINERTMRKYIAGDLVIPELLVWALRGLAEREQEQMRVREELDLVRREIDGE
jgi:transcriptional regulator with XRE-family HTH domain